MVPLGCEDGEVGGTCVGKGGEEDGGEEEGEDKGIGEEDGTCEDKGGEEEAEVVEESEGSLLSWVMQSKLEKRSPSEGGRSRVVEYSEKGG
jgi:hypothetical protein